VLKKLRFHIHRFSIMVYKTFLAFSLGFIVATRGAPTALDPATLLQNAEEAQALNRQFQGLNVSDPCTGAFCFFVVERLC
jgi:hypothetical protein